MVPLNSVILYIFLGFRKWSDRCLLNVNDRQIGVPSLTYHFLSKHCSLFTVSSCFLCSDLRNKTCWHIQNRQPWSQPWSLTSQHSQNCNGSSVKLCWKQMQRESIHHSHSSVPPLCISRRAISPNVLSWEWYFFLFSSLYFAWYPIFQFVFWSDVSDHCRQKLEKSQSGSAFFTVSVVRHWNRFSREVMEVYGSVWSVQGQVGQGF